MPTGGRVGPTLAVSAVVVAAALAVAARAQGGREIWSRRLRSITGEDPQNCPQLNKRWLRFCARCVPAPGRRLLGVSVI
jgi:hypothetical protein